MGNATAPKICVKCGDDCAGKPRTKDSSGRYLCKPCFEKKQAKTAATPSAPIPLAEPDVGEFDPSLVLSLADENGSPVETSPCPSCGAGLRTGAVICTTCGYNVKTGTSMRSVVGKAAPGDDDEKASKLPTVAGALVAVPSMLLMGCVGAVVGGMIGAGIWAAIAYNPHIQIRLIAILLGLFTGGGMLVGARGCAGNLTGMLSAIIAAGCVAAGHYMVVSTLVDNYLKHQPNVRTIVNDDFATSELADAIIQRHQEEGVKDEWPRGHSEENAEAKEDYPPKVWAEAEAEWSKKTPEEKEEMKADLESLLRSSRKEIASTAKSMGFFASFDLFDAIYCLFAMGTAFVIGSGRNFSGD